MRYPILAVVIFFAAGCGPIGSPAAQAVAHSTGSSSGSSGPSLTICSKLDFSGLNWDATLPVAERDPVALALNISGSFEGNSGWINLTNDFDGQGLSLGLLNQCLGQGSLQPLMIQMRDTYPAEMDAQFSAANLTSLLGMLSLWQTSASALRIPASPLSAYGLSTLDDAAAIEQITGSSLDKVRAALSSKNQASVNWAVSNLYNGSSFKADWSQELTSFAQTAGYRSIQVSAALALHASALDLFKTFGLTQIRSYLFFFDIVVQDGGIPSNMITQILAEFKSNPTWDETQKLEAILTARLAIVNPAYQADVRSRKQSIIDGTGTVHGVRRDYDKEYCANLTAPMP